MDTSPVALAANQSGLFLDARADYAQAEALKCLALAIDEQSCGPEHPGVARDLHNLGQLLQATNQLAEAESLMRRALAILLQFTATTSYEHPRLQTAFNNYVTLLEVMGRSPAQIRAQLEEAVGPWLQGSNGFRSLPNAYGFLVT